MDRLEEMAIEDQLKERKDAVDRVDRIVLPVPKGCEGRAGVEECPVDDRDNKVEGHNGGVEEPVEVAPPRRA